MNVRKICSILDKNPYKRRMSENFVEMVTLLSDNEANDDKSNQSPPRI